MGIGFAGTCFMSHRRKSLLRSGEKAAGATLADFEFGVGKGEAVLDRKTDRAAIMCQASGV
jgi:hypothetical protein